MSAASHRGVDGPVITGQMASAFMVDRNDDVADPLLQTDRDRLNELHAELAEPSANAMPVTPVRAGRHGSGACSCRISTKTNVVESRRQISQTRSIQRTEYGKDGSCWSCTRN